MKIGQSVTYVAPDGSERAVQIVDFVEHGPEPLRNWRLSFGEELPDVPHEADNTGAGFWRLGDPSPAAPPSKRSRKAQPQE